MGWFSNLFHREQSQNDQAQPNRYQQLFSSFDHASMRNATPEQLAANRAQLHDLFASKTWNSLDYDTKCQAVQALENDFAYQQGRPAKHVEAVPLDDLCYGGWNPELDTIHLNENLLKNGTTLSDPNARPMPDANMQVFDTVAHEGYHAYQSYALEHPEVHADKAQLREWALNEGKYYDNGDKYLIQPQERDAWQYGDSSTTQAFQGIEARNGPEPELTKAEYENHALTSSYSAALAREQRRDPQVLQTMEKEMESACQQHGIKYDFTGQSQTAGNAPQPQAQGVQQGQAPPGPVIRTISAQSIDMSYARGMDSPEFWNHHGNTKADYMALAEKLPAVQAGLAQGRTVDELKQDPELRGCVNAYYDPDNMVKVIQTPDGGYEYEDNGRHRIMAAKEMGCDIPVQVVNAQAYAQAQAQDAGGKLRQDAQPEQVQTEGQEQLQEQDQEQLQEQDQEQLQEQDQEQFQEQDQEQLQEQDQEQDQEQLQEQDQEQLQEQDQEQLQNEDLSMDQMTQQEPEESQQEAQTEDLSMDQMAQQEPEESQQEAQTEDLSMDQMAQQEPEESQQQTQSEDLSMDQAAGEDVSGGEEQSSGQEEDQSQGYSY
ncbi:hypothetical protein WMO64_10670 [Pseudoflavonifractor sp. CLA-AP-H29]|uniref:ParB/Sulfiredoxin domain-containing protein n=1 Tax=Pseudoflavonifractor intestinihominis TaxID=3133171 RepID=A0ABV1EB45_9FIRM